MENDFFLETVAKGDLNPGSLDCESGILPLSYQAPMQVLHSYCIPSSKDYIVHCVQSQVNAYKNTYIPWCGHSKYRMYTSGMSLGKKKISDTFFGMHNLAQLGVWGAL